MPTNRDYQEQEPGHKPMSDGVQLSHWQRGVLGSIAIFLSLSPIAAASQPSAADYPSLQQAIDANMGPPDSMPAVSAHWKPAL